MKLRIAKKILFNLEQSWTDEFTLIELVETKEYQAARAAAKGGE